MKQMKIEKIRPCARSDPSTAYESGRGRGMDRDRGGQTERPETRCKSRSANRAQNRINQIRNGQAPCRSVDSITAGGAGESRKNPALRCSRAISQTSIGVDRKCPKAVASPIISTERVRYAAFRRGALPASTAWDAEPHSQWWTGGLGFGENVNICTGGIPTAANDLWTRANRLRGKTCSGPA